MSINEEILRQAVTDDFMRGFLETRENDIRMKVSVISSLCGRLAKIEDEKCNADFRRETAETILQQCSGLLKLTDLYRMIVDAMIAPDGGMDVVEVSEFITEFCRESGKRVKGVCEIVHVPGNTCVRKTSEKFLLFSLLILVRRAVADGAKVIEIGAQKNNRIMITMNITEYSEPPAVACMEDDITLTFSDDIVRMLLRKINCTLRRGERSVDILMPLDGADSLSFSKPRTKPAKRMFEPYNDLLSDFCKINFID